MVVDEGDGQGAANGSEAQNNCGQNQSISEYFSQMIEERLQDIRAEFIILNKITFHQDHARHLIYLRLTDDPQAADTIICQIDEIQHQNRHMTCLPYHHSQVKVIPMK